jgi:hypothetical protein
LRVHDDDVGVYEPASHTGFPMKAPDERFVLHVLAMKDFHGDRAFDVLLLASVYAAHGADADQALEKDLAVEHDADVRILALTPVVRARARGERRAIARAEESLSAVVRAAGRAQPSRFGHPLRR